MMEREIKRLTEQASFRVVMGDFDSGFFGVFLDEFFESQVATGHVVFAEAFGRKCDASELS